jgi:hypothetical protein
MSQAPELVFLDPRVAFRLPGTKGEAGEAQAGGSDEPVGYIRQDIFEEKLRQAANVDQELIIQIQTVGSVLYGLSNLGRLFVQGVVMGEDGWHLTADRELVP